MSWLLRISHDHRDRFIQAHQEAWKTIEAKVSISALDYQAEHDRLGYILVELWQTETPDGELVALAIARFDTGPLTDRS